MGTIDSTDKGWPTGESGWLKEVPWGFRKLLNWIKNVRDGWICVYVYVYVYVCERQMDARTAPH